MHLTFVIFVADPVEIVIEDLVYVVLFYFFKFLIGLFKFFLALIELKHDLMLSLEDLSKKFSLNFDHSANFACLIEPVVYECSHTVELAD